VKLILVIFLTLTTSAAMAKIESTKNIEKKLRGPAQVGPSTVRNLIHCDLQQNDLELKSIEIFGAVSESVGNVAISDIHSLVEISARGGHRMIYKGGTISANGVRISGTVSVAGQSGEINFDGKSGSLTLNSKQIATSQCRSIFQ